MIVIWHLPVPQYMAHSIYDLTPDFFTSRGIKLLLLDLDNTLLPYETFEPNEELLKWLSSMTAAGIEPFIFSNNRGGRPAHFSKLLNIGFIGKAKKPNPRRLWEVLAQKSIAKENAALVGDQIYTDIFCGKRGGILTVSVRPISIKNPLRALRYAAEFPFRLAGKFTAKKVSHD
jgi:HAD superfamily (subfamily IIIA) phosphatase, TIGR01668